MAESQQVVYAESKESWTDYRKAGLRRAAALKNRGPIRFGNDGRLIKEIRDAYNRTGFYVFENVLAQEEIEEVTREFDEVLANAPTEPDGPVDRFGRASKFSSYYTLYKPNDAADDTEEFSIVGLITHPLVLMDSALHVYGHPKILRMVASINGDDFIPFHEAMFHKGAGEGPPTPWHQDGRTHWTAEGEALESWDGSGKTHGFNLSVALSRCTPENCLWVVPKSHKQWRRANGGSFPEACTKLADAVPMTLEQGDIGMVNRSSLHGSFPNHSDIRRVTLLMGFHKRDSAIGTETTNVHAYVRPDKPKKVKYSKDYVLKRARMIPLAIDARRQRFPDETPYEYSGDFIGGDIWNEQARAEITREGDEYWQRDITL